MPHICFYSRSFNQREHQAQKPLRLSESIQHQQQQQHQQHLRQQFVMIDYNLLNSRVLFWMGGGPIYIFRDVDSDPARSKIGGFRRFVSGSGLSMNIQIRIPSVSNFSFNRSKFEG